MVNMTNKLVFSKKVVLLPLLNGLKNIDQTEVLAKINELEAVLEKKYDRRQMITNLLSKQYIEPTLYIEQNRELLAEAEKLRNEKEALYRSLDGEFENSKAVSRLLKYVNTIDRFAEFEPLAFEAHVDHIIVYSRNEIGFALKCGLNFKVRI